MDTKELLKEIVGLNEDELYQLRRHLIDRDLMKETLGDFKRKVKDVIDKYIKTDVQGIPLPECKILWEIKKELNI